MMKLVNHKQGTPEWLQYRATMFNASDAPAMLGVSPYKTRDEFLREFVIGIAPEVTPERQYIFDRGHAIEEAARPLAAKIIGEILSPCVGYIDGSRISASFDGLTFLRKTAWECKSLNAALRAVLPEYHEGDTIPEIGHLLPEHYRAQLEQQSFASGCERTLFSAASIDSTGSITEIRHCWYKPDPEMRHRIIFGWEQFETDIADYAPEPIKATPVAAPVESFSALVLHVEGKVTSANLEVFKAQADEYIAHAPRPNELQTDQQFVDADAWAKATRTKVEQIRAAKAAALSQMEQVDAAFRIVDAVDDLLTQAAIALEKAVKVEKENRKTAIVTEARAALAKHAQTLNSELQAIDAGQLPSVRDDFAGSIKGMRSLDSMQNQITADLMRERAALDDMARRMRTNRAALKIDGQDWKFLFADFASVSHMETEAFAGVVQIRVAKYKIEQDERQKLIDEEKAAQAAIAEAKAAQEVAAPLLDDISALARDARDDAMAQIDANRVISTAQASAATVNVNAPQIAQTADTGSMLTIGQINERLQPIKLDASGIESLGFALTKVRSAVQFPESQFTALCEAVAKVALLAGAPQQPVQHQAAPAAQEAPQKRAWKPAQAFSDKEYEPIPMAKVESSQIRSIGYDLKRKTLAVTFARGPGHIYHYPDVDARVYENFMCSQSKGDYFAAHIKDLPFDKFQAREAA